MILASWGPLGKVLGALLGRLGGLLGRLEAVLKPSWASWAERSATRGFLDRLGCVLEPSWLVLGPSWARKSHAGKCGQPQKI